MAENKEHTQDEDALSVDGDFKAPPQKSIAEMLQQDQEDEALNRYKQTLLGQAANQAGMNEEPTMELVKLVVIPVEGKQSNLEYSIECGANFEKTSVKDKKVKSVKCLGKNQKLIESSKYYAEMHFKVKTGIISGLKYNHVVSKSGINLDKQKLMVGSFAASDKEFVFKTQEEVAPSGMIGRGNYKITSKFTDDDGNLYCQFEWELDICKPGKV